MPIDPLDTTDWYRSDWMQFKILAAGKAGGDGVNLTHLHEGQPG